MSVLRQFLYETYAADPAAAARFASNAYVLVRVRRRQWRGHRRMASAEVSVDGGTVGAAAVTRPSWKLIPDAVKTEFDVLDRQVEQELTLYAVNRQGGMGTGPDDDETSDGPVLVGGGTYAIDAAVWPRLETILRKAQEKWTVTADKWCSPEGYAELHRQLAEQVGEADYTRVKDLVPKPDDLRRKFGLIVRRAPTKIVEDTTGDPGLEAGRREELVDLFELAVRGPREHAAGVWEGLSTRLVNPDGTPVIPVRAEKTVARAVQTASVVNARREADALGAAGRYLDDRLAELRVLVQSELPSEVGPAREVVKKLNTDDTTAVRIGTLLGRAAVAARDETGMCAGFARATGRPGPT